MNTPAHLTLACPTCREPIRVPCQYVSTDPKGVVVTVQLDARAARAHSSVCRPAPTSSTPTTVGPVDALLAGARTCTLCGTTNTDCIASLSDNAASCCAGCGDGDTHPRGDLTRDAR